MNSLQSQTRNWFRLNSLFVVGILFLIWLNEIVDLPWLILGSVKTPINWRESLLETIFILLAFATFSLLYRRMTRRIHELENLVVVCSHCKKIKSPDGWIGFQDYLFRYSEKLLSHGICDECLARFYPEFAGEKLRPQQDDGKS